MRGLEEIEPAFGLFQGKMYAGRLPMNNLARTGEMMFWLFAHDKPMVDDSLIIWLNGGPGCSSVAAGVLFEHSPVTVPLHPAGFCCTSKDDPFVYNRHSWANASAILYVEQPVGTGFSFGNDIPHSEDDVAGDFYAFLQNFYTVFTQYQRHRLFVTGESYAGYYVSAIARRIHVETEKILQMSSSSSSRTKKRASFLHHATVNTVGAPWNVDSSTAIPINLAGIALGNGWIDARVQGPITIVSAFL